MFTKILIANRGEIACRVIATAKRLGIKTVAVYSEADAHALHRELADEAVFIGAAAAQESYLCAEKIIDAARKTGAEAIHPGYGFLSENAQFCQTCESAGITFIGPSAEAITAMGCKSTAKQLMANAGVPVLAGYHAADQSDATLHAAAQDIGYPVLLKAVAGGGGKGMRLVQADTEFAQALAGARREARKSFNNDDMLVEKYLRSPRHVEVQVFCDKHSNGVYLFERDCSLQRRHQKVIEEAPAPGLSDQLRQSLGEAAVRAAQAIDYVGAGTVEFLLDASGQFYFMEMNTRLQVEHPVTEMITGVDLVHWQFMAAYGDVLPLTQQELSINGHAFEARIYAEDPSNDFLPATGKILALTTPEPSTDLRVETGVRSGDTITIYYDPMIAKLVVWAKDRDTALARLVNALKHYQIVGVASNIAFLTQLASHPDFSAAAVSTQFIDQHLDQLKQALTNSTHVLSIEQKVSVAALYYWLGGDKNTVQSPWQGLNRWRLNMPASDSVSIVMSASRFDARITQQVTDKEIFTVVINCATDSAADNIQFEVRGRREGNRLTAAIDGIERIYQIATENKKVYLVSDDISFQFEFSERDFHYATVSNKGNGAALVAPMNGSIATLAVAVGEPVSEGQTLLVVEAMKMEHSICAPCDGKVTEFYFAAGDLVTGGAQLLNFQAADE